MRRFDYDEEEIASGLASKRFRQLLAFQVDRARLLFREGAPLVETLDGVVKLNVALFTKGGVAILDAIEGRNYDVLSTRPALSRTRKAMVLASSWLAWKLGRKLGFSLVPKNKYPRGPSGSATSGAP